MASFAFCDCVGFTFAFLNHCQRTSCPRSWDQLSSWTHGPGTSCPPGHMVLGPAVLLDTWSWDQLSPWTHGPGTSCPPGHMVLGPAVLLDTWSWDQLSPWTHGPGTSCPPGRGPDVSRQDGMAPIQFSVDMQPCVSFIKPNLPS